MNYESSGLSFVQSVPEPGVGNNFTVTVPTGEIWLLHYIKIRFVGDGTGGYNRDIVLRYIDPLALVVGISGASASSRISGAANTLMIGSINGGNYNNTESSCYSVPLPTVYLPEGYTIESNIQNLTAADRLYQIEIGGEKWAL